VEQQELEHQAEMTPLDMVERDFSMLFDISLFVILFSLLEFMKTPWLDASLDNEDKAGEAQDEPVRVEFLHGGAIEVDGVRYAVEGLTADAAREINAKTQGRRVQVTIPSDLQTGSWFAVAYGITLKAKSVEFTTK
jgi:hypothetical protein